MSNPTPDPVALLLELADAPEAIARTHLMPLLGTFQPVAGRGWQEFSVKANIAVVLLRGGKVQDALRIAMAALDANPADPLAQAVIVEIRAFYYDQAIRSLHQRRPDTARTFLRMNTEVLGRGTDTSVEQCLFDIIDFVEDAAVQPRAPTAAPQGRPTVINLAVWGERFIDAAVRTFLPCCLAPGNVPELRKHGTVYLRIHTSDQDVAHIQALPVIKELAEHACIEIVPIPQNILQGKHRVGKGPWNRMIFAALQFVDFAYARSLSADFMIGVADLLMTERCYGAAKEHLLAGRKAVVLQISRASSRKILALIDAGGFRQGNRLLIASEPLYRASLEAIHPHILQTFMRRTPTRLSTDPISFYVRTPGGFTLRTLQLNVFAAATGHLPARLTCDFHSTDTRLLSDLLIGQDRAQACYIEHRIPAEMFAVSLDEEEGVATFGNFELSPAGSAESIVKWVGRDEDVDHFIWAVQQKFDYPVPADIKLDMPDDCRDPDEAVSEIIERLRARRQDVLNYIHQFQGGAGV